LSPLDFYFFDEFFTFQARPFDLISRVIFGFAVNYYSFSLDALLMRSKDLVKYPGCMFHYNLNKGGPES